MMQLQFGTANKEERDEIAKLLLQNKLVADAFAFEGESKYHWYGTVAEAQCYHLHATTKKEHKEAISKLIEQTSQEEVPFLLFKDVDLSPKMHHWVEQSLQKIE